jgi:hypothetical protein
MSMKTKLAVAVATVMLAVGFSTVAAAGAAMPTVLHTRTGAAVVLPTAGGVSGKVVSLTVGAGSWTVTSDVTAINFGPGDFVRCQLRTVATVIDGGSTVYLADRVGGLTNVGVLVATRTVTVSVQCSHDSVAGSSAQFYIDPGATLTAVKRGPISAPGLPPASAPAVVQARSTSNTPLVANAFTTVTSVTVGTGTWAITANADAVNFSEFDWAACRLFGATGTATTVGTGGNDAIVSGLDLEGTATLLSTGTITLSCESDFASTDYVDAGATLTATSVAPAIVKSFPIALVALPNAGGVSHAVLTRTMPAGAWRVRSEVQVGHRNPNNSWGGSNDFLRCSIAANGTPIDGGATTRVTENSNIQQVVDAGAFTSTSSWTLTVSCSHDSVESGPGHWTVAMGGVVAVNKGPIAQV